MLYQECQTHVASGPTDMHLSSHQMLNPASVAPALGPKLHIVPIAASPGGVLHVVFSGWSRACTGLCYLLEQAQCSACIPDNQNRCHVRLVLGPIHGASMMRSPWSGKGPPRGSTRAR